jgi:uncharacterized cupin superfamily protein
LSRWVASRITDLPVVSDGEPDDPVWYPLQYALGIDTFGANVFVARHAGQVLVEEHDERDSGQQELYVVLDGSAEFELDGEERPVERGDALAVTDPGVRRRAKALAAGTVLLVVGSPDGPFGSTWDAAHFADIPRPS